ncbi:hypothetical protein DFA_00963 [Cavenderia fasciculata]|uniref:SET domain-containing protein n=1 Tax=Cavenderia fasciculata TaxID=261658 RepID=F4PUR9_CACFS|nr:uncharacterized protein DFA_00963 [Cavenderia fasciculata]EGG21088.1 hypothetical protein DFA_00963 [Cavenderia fasciculata]|eukprot:XP_004358938.1 hypothetical protein DFA_00963 [Cavenderia fasciculata]
MIRQKRLSKSKAIKTIGSIQDGSFEAIDNTPSPISPSAQMKHLVRPSISNRKKQLLVQQYINGQIAQTELIMTKGRGNGVRVCHHVEAGVLVAEYKGDLINKSEALKREKQYAKNSTTVRMDCYLFYFEHKGKIMCVDPTIPSEDLGHGRYINHRIDCNLDPIKISINGDPKIVLVSNRSIQNGEEVFFDYGDRSAASLTYFPWLMDGYQQQQLQLQQQQQKNKNNGIQDEEDEDIDVGVDNIQSSPRVKQTFGFSKYINRFKYAGYLLSDSECSSSEESQEEEEEGTSFSNTIDFYSNNNNNNNNHVTNTITSFKEIDIVGSISILINNNNQQAAILHPPTLPPIVICPALLDLQFLRGSTKRSWYQRSVSISSWNPDF